MPGNSSITCPVCGLVVKDARGLAAHFRHQREAGDTSHPEYLARQEEAQWEGKIEDIDYVRCLSCGLRTVTLARHLKAAHRISADEYRVLYGPEAKIRCDSLMERRSVAIAARVLHKGEKKSIDCPSCGTTWEGSKYLVPGTHDLRCERCRTEENAKSEVKRWVGKSEPEDYVTCRVCGYHAENLTSHLQSVHRDLLGAFPRRFTPYKLAYPGAEVVARTSKVRDKKAIRGTLRSSEFRQKVALGKTGQTHAPEIRAKMSASQLLVGRIVRLCEEDFAPYKMKNGKVSLARASLGMDRYFGVVKRECVRLGLPYHRLSVNQDRFLGLLSKLLGCDYEPEWNSTLFVNPKTGRRFKFDGFFEGANLLAEFQGYQHYTFPNRFHKVSHEDAYLEAKERDAEKRRQVLSFGKYRYLEVREDQPWDDLEYLRGLIRNLSSK